MSQTLYQHLQSSLIPPEINIGSEDAKKRIEEFKAYFLDQSILDKIKKDLRVYNRFLKTSLNRKEIQLRYYQILALYFTQWYFDHKKDDELKLFSKEMVAYWMATGSGKTIIMHINILQYLRQLPHFDQLDLIVTTPLVNLIHQHIDEIQPWIDFLNTNYFKSKIDLTIDTTSTLLNKDKKYPNFYQMPDNPKYQRLVLVDEAHIGLSSTEEGAFQSFRKKLNQRNSFLFEYSATFTNLNSELDLIYSKSIIYDYSYRCFYDDGFGKDFFLKQVREDVTVSQDEEINHNLDENFRYLEDRLNIWKNFEYADQQTLSGFRPVTRFPDKPLLAFMGRTVDDPKKEGKEGDEIGDIKKIVYFLADLTPVQREAYQLCFNTNIQGKLTLTRLKDIPDEILLSYGDGEYFGIINVGNGDSFFNSIDHPNIEKKKNHGIIRLEYLFANLDDNRSPINILIGSRKFAEGWNCYRVAIIGLINLGTSKGNKIVQIFGRGVRLHGQYNDGKRWHQKHCSDYEHADPQTKLETLVVLSLKNTYLKQFTKEVLDSIDIVKTYGPYPVSTQAIPIGNGTLEPFEIYAKKLPIFHTTKETINHIVLICKKDTSIDAYTLNCVHPNIIRGECIPLDYRTHTENADSEIDIYPELISLVKNNRYFIDQAALFKRWQNICTDKLVQIFNNDDKSIKKADIFDLLPFVKEVIVNDHQKVRTLAHLETLLYRMQDDIINVLKNKVSYIINSSKYTISPSLSDGKDGSTRDFITNYYLTKRFPTQFKTERDIENEIVQFESQLHTIINQRIIRKDNRHIYHPLWTFQDSDFESNISTSPVSINAGEKKFVQDLHDYIDINYSDSKRYEFYLLRNEESLRSVGIYLEDEQQVYYPDFILWIIDTLKQNIYINFIDPKGQMGLYIWKRLPFLKRQEIKKQAPSQTYDMVTSDLQNNSAAVVSDRAKLGNKDLFPVIRQLETKLKTQFKNEYTFHLQFFILLRDSSQWGKSSRDEKTIKEMLSMNMYRLDWHDTNEEGIHIDRYKPNGKSYLDLMFSKIGIELSSSKVVKY